MGKAVIASLLAYKMRMITAAIVLMPADSNSDALKVRIVIFVFGVKLHVFKIGCNHQHRERLFDFYLMNKDETGKFYPPLW